MAGLDEPGTTAVPEVEVTDSDPPVDDRPRVDKSTVLSWLTTSAPVIGAVLTTIWVFRVVLFRGQLPGDIGDARWTIALHEHWYQVWRGQESIRDLHYFFPLQRTLGTSDAFLVQGQLYSITRALGIGLVDSWLIAQILFFLLGAVGTAVLAKRILRSTWSQVAFVVLTCASYPVLVQTTHVQLIGFLSCSWILVGLHDLVTGRNVKGGLALVLIVPPVLAMSSWYAFVLIAIVIGFLGAFLLMVSSWNGIASQVRRVGSDILTALRSPVGVALVVLFVAGWAFVLWIYLPSRSLLPSSSWAEVVVYSPRLTDLVNASAGGGGIWSSLYSRVFDPSTFNSELALGFTPILLGAFLLSGFFQIRSGMLGVEQPATGAGRPGRSGLVAAWFAVIGILAFFLIDERAASLYRFFWFHVPGLESIRNPFRIQTMLFAIAAFVVLRTLELLWDRSTRWRTVRWRRVGWRRWLFVVGAATLVVLMVVESQRPIYSSWTRSDLLSPALLAQADDIRDSCDALALVGGNASDPVWLTAINAVILSAVTGVPTPQGYSRADPIGYPGPDSDAADLLAWMRGQGFTGRLCSVSPDSIQIVTGS